MKPEAIMHADINNAYFNFTRAFDPTLEGKAVCILSNGDGCVVARSPAAKALGIKMGDPWFKIRPLAEKHGVIPLSSQYELYADMSNRFMEVVEGMLHEVERYSVDEAFCRLTGMPGPHEDIGRRLRERLRRWLGLPVCVGIGSSKTLAKFADFLAKKLPEFDGVCDLNAMPPARVESYMGKIDVSEIWGVGRRIAPKLNDLGIRSVLDLRRANPERIRSHFNVLLEKTVRELGGLSCIEMQDAPIPRQQIMSSRSFSNAVTEFHHLAEAITAFTSRAAEKLRGEEAVARTVMVFVSTSYFAEGEWYGNSKVVTLPAPTSDTLRLLDVALWGLRQIYRPGVDYKKAGVMLGEIVPAAGSQGELFGYTAMDERSARLMEAVDRINRRWGKQTVRPASQGSGEAWKMRQDYLCPAYTTRWEDIAIVS